MSRNVLWVCVCVCVCNNEGWQINQTPQIIHSDQEVLNGHVRQQLIGDAGEFHGQLLLQLRLHGLQHLQAVLAQKQIGGFGWTNEREYVKLIAQTSANHANTHSESGCS